MFVEIKFDEALLIVLLVEHGDEVIVALLVVADEEIFGASVRINDFDIFAIADMKKWLMLGELEFNIFVPEELANFSLVH